MSSGKTTTAEGEAGAGKTSLSWHIPKSGLMTLTLIVLFVLALLTVFDVGGRALLWINSYWLAASAGAFTISLSGFPPRGSPQRPVRLALSAGIGAYVAGQLVWAAQVINDFAVVPGPSDLFFLVAQFPLFWGALLAIRREVSKSYLMVTSLDALTMLFASIAVVLATLGSRAGGLSGIELMTTLAYPAFYLAPVGAFLVVALALPMRPGFYGIWLTLAGTMVIGGSFSAWTFAAITSVPDMGTLIDFMFGIGALLIGCGAATWSTQRVHDPVLLRHMKALSQTLPLIATVASVIFLLASDMPAGIEMTAWAAVILLLLVNGVRQLGLLQAQRRYQQQLRLLATELTTAEERERRQIAVYLHDTVAQQIVTLQMRFDEYRQSGADVDRDSIADTIANSLSTTADEIRATTFELSPPSLYDFGLSSAVGSLADTHRQRFSYDVKVRDELQDNPAVKPVAPLVYQFVRELLMNVVKHAEATTATVSLAAENNVLEVSVEDNGKGFDADQSRDDTLDGFGLYSIRERATAVGGEVEIQSVANEGTTVTIRLPLLPVAGHEYDATGGHSLASAVTISGSADR